MLYFFFFVFGLAVGSFINVISLRYQPTYQLTNLKTLKLLVGGRSHCPICDKKLNWYELAPIFSFIIQKGKCRNCGSRISRQYPIVEFLSGLIFAGVYWRFNNLDFSFLISHLSPLVIVWILIFILFLLLSIIDIRHYLIPDSINLSLAVLGVILMLLKLTTHYSSLATSFLGHYASLFDFPPLLSLSSSMSLSIWLNHLFAAVAAAGFFAAIIIITRGRAMGWGDFKLAGVLGLIFGWPDIFLVIGLSFIIGSLIVLPFLIRGKKKMKDFVPFGPFLVLAATLVFFFGFEIINAYFKFFGIIY
jgi:prepilin signal peptidase PulO-like enzyme (type II secretory pathway)